VKHPHISSKLEIFDHQHLPNNMKISILDDMWMDAGIQNIDGCPNLFPQLYLVTTIWLTFFVYDFKQCGVISLCLCLTFIVLK